MRYIPRHAARRARFRPKSLTAAAVTGLALGAYAIAAPASAAPAPFFGNNLTVTASNECANPVAATVTPNAGSPADTQLQILAGTAGETLSNFAPTSGAIVSVNSAGLVTATTSGEGTATQSVTFTATEGACVDQQSVSVTVTKPVSGPDTLSAAGTATPSDQVTDIATSQTHFNEVTVSALPQAASCVFTGEPSGVTQVSAGSCELQLAAGTPTENSTGSVQVTDSAGSVATATLTYSVNEENVVTENCNNGYGVSVTQNDPVSGDLTVTADSGADDVTLASTQSSELEIVSGNGTPDLVLTGTGADVDETIVVDVSNVDNAASFTAEAEPGGLFSPSNITQCTNFNHHPTAPVRNYYSTGIGDFVNQYGNGIDVWQRKFFAGAILRGWTATRSDPATQFILTDVSDTSHPLDGSFRIEAYDGTTGNASGLCVENDGDAVLVTCNFDTDTLFTYSGDHVISSSNGDILTPSGTGGFLSFTPGGSSWPGGSDYVWDALNQLP